MSHWPDRRILDLLGIELPILQAPMAGATGSAMAIAVGLAGGLGALPCAMLSGEQVRAEIAAFRAGCPGRPLNLNFFCHQPPAPDAERDARWKQALEPYYSEVGGGGAGPPP
ncbi:nitronate monooxygenase, partial [Pseudomonas sp.]|uniref:nitronate monooxygenase n=1 Tax=Pseudomonas sp. TaxID=306 RepID=UPI00264A0409